jgi:hypothetical protein
MPFFYDKELPPYYNSMIYVEKAVNTRVALTLSESSHLVSPYYLFVITSDFNTSFTPLVFTTPDLSGYPERFNLFEFNLDIPMGEYTYTVYEATTPPTEIDDTTGIVVESGILIVHTTEDVNTSVYL